ncbi:hypothetical protein M9H77_17646 [Catharanthus roseus]|uniref:Uncharacterized protein n=1 Tax=Catharanthus roseus TaxID=4058 RepID=A0ACC0B5J7_CATRO|nr:hypothetical protein M9H77_17646 [Catharanthus roseus]
MEKYIEKWKKGPKPVEEKSANKGNVNNEDRGKKPRVGVEFSDFEIIGDPGLRKPIDSYPYEIRDELRRRSYWISSFDRVYLICYLKILIKILSFDRGIYPVSDG